MAEKPRYDSKYAKIQPAVAIKPKPVKGQSPSKVSFDPKYDPLKSVVNILGDESNINTLRQWVLPPRPRPGRKPTLKEGSVLPVAAKPLPKTAANSAKGSVSGNVGLPSLSGKVASAVGKGRCTFSAGAVPRSVSESPCSETEAKADSVQEITTLQKALLARLKEQELVQNYIEVLTNQIHELKLAQSGVITFDALSLETAPKRKVHTSPDQLDHIHNVRDLDKFLAHLTTQSKVIHSVTKKYVSENSDPNLLQQIKRHLQLKKNLETAQQPERRPALPKPAKTDQKAKLFTPSLLRPMNLNAFEEDDVIDVDIIKDSDIFDRQRSDEEMLERRRRGCGFCSGEAPCLCFDADSLFGERLT